jgi:hypothetical protein
MNHKIMGFFVCTPPIATKIPTAASIQHNMKPYMDSRSPVISVTLFPISMD